jgi:hypothetical protein
MRLRGALIWEAGGEPQRDEVFVSDERPNGTNSHIVILDRGGQPRAASPKELPAGSVLLLPPDASDLDVDRIQGSGFVTRRDLEADELDPDGDSEERRAAMAAADAELEEVIERLSRVLQQRHPELFDARGRLLPGAYARKMRERTGGGKTLTREEYIELTGGSRALSDDSSSDNAP